MFSLCYVKDITDIKELLNISLNNDQATLPI